MKKQEWILLITIWVMLAVGIAFAFCGCNPGPKAVPPSPDFAPTKAAAEAASNSAVMTDTLVKTLAQAHQNHAADTQPTSVFVANTKPVIAATTQSSAATVKATAAVAPAVKIVEKETEDLHANAVENHDGWVNSDKKLEQEKTSWFGGKIGRMLWWGLVIGGTVIGLGLLAKGAALAFPGAWAVEAFTPLTMVGNVVAWIFKGIWKAFTAVWNGVQWVWDEVILAHIPWPETKPTTTTPPTT